MHACSPQALGMHIRQITCAHVATITYYFLLFLGNKPESAGLFENTTTDPAKIIFAFYAALWAYDGW